MRPSRPSYNVGDIKDVHALEVLSPSSWAAGPRAKLYRKLVVEQQVAAAFSASYDGETVSYGTFAVAMTPGARYCARESRSRRTMRRSTDLLKDGITDADLGAGEKRRLAAQMAYAKDSPISRGAAVGASLDGRRFRSTTSKRGRTRWRK